MIEGRPEDKHFQDRVDAIEELRKSQLWSSSFRRTVQLKNDENLDNDVIKMTRNDKNYNSDVWNYWYSSYYYYILYVCM